MVLPSMELNLRASLARQTTPQHRPYARSGTPPGSFQERNVPYVHHGYEVFRLPRRGTCRGPVVVLRLARPEAMSGTGSLSCDLLRMQRPPSHAQQHSQGQLTGVSPWIITERLQNRKRKI